MNRSCRNVVALIAGICAVGACGWTLQSRADEAKDDVAQKLIKVEKDIADAIVKKTGKYGEEAMASDYVFIDPTGRMFDKNNANEDIRNGKLEFTQMKCDEMKVRRYGDCAVLVGITHIKGSYEKQDISGSYRFTDVFVNQAGKWMLVNSQLTPIMDMKGPPPGAGQNK